MALCAGWGAMVLAPERGRLPECEVMYREMNRLWPVMPSLRPLREKEPLSKAESPCQALIALAKRALFFCCALVFGFAGLTYARTQVAPLYE